jgi:hypothetical protein
MAAFAQLMATSGGNVGAAMSSGVRLGGDMVASASGALPIVSPDGRLFAYRTAFYADASTPVEASIVSLTSGDERAGADFQLRLTPTVRVSGVAIGSEGPVANLPVRLVVPGDRIMSDTEFDVATSITTADGRFSFYGVPPGQFLLRAQKMPMPGFAPAPGSPSDAPLFAAMNLPVDTTEIEDLTVRLSEALTISGRVEFESQKGAAAPAAPKGAGLMLLPADGQTPNILALGRPTPIGSDGTFRREGIVPGRYFFNLVSVPAPWQVKGATLDGRDVYDRPLEIRTGDLANVVVTLTDQLAQLSGIVSAPVSFTSAEAVVILFPADYRTWIDSGMNPRLVRTAPVAASGTYTVPNLTAGDYLAVAIDRGDEGDLQDPAFIEILSRAATRVSIAADARAQSLTVARVRR